jgi:hypothetical protein
MIRPSSGTNLMKIGGVFKKWHTLEFGGSKIQDGPHILATVGLLEYAGHNILAYIIIFLRSG